MSDLVYKEHALSAFLNEFGNSVPTQQSRVQIEVVPFLVQINIRLDPKNSQWKQKIERVIAQELPIRANTVTRLNHSVYWLGPSEWLLVSSDCEIYRQLLEVSQNGITALSGGQLMLRIRGEKASSLMSKACTLDLHDNEFGTNDCAQSNFAKASALISLLNEEPTFEVVIRRSFVDYVARWLQHTGAEFGVIFTQSSPGD